MIGRGLRGPLVGGTRECNLIDIKDNFINFGGVDEVYNYFDDFWIDCKICHHESGDVTLKAQPCSKCHHTHPAGIADETLSSKVVIHKSCWECHEIGTGGEATTNCKLCHSGPRTEYKKDNE